MVDPVVSELRALIAASDREVVEAVNRRLELVARLWEHKRGAGIDVVDPDRERTLLAELAAANAGPLTDDGLRELVQALLDLTKRELERRG